MAASQITVLQPLKTFIELMEQTKRPTISLVLPMVHKMLLLLEPSRTLHITDYETEADTEIKVSCTVLWTATCQCTAAMPLACLILLLCFFQGEDLHPSVCEVQTTLRSDLKRRFVTEEREGHMEDLLIATMLDPRFKHFVFPGATQAMRETAERYFRAAYDADWSPEAIERRREAERLRKEKEEAKAKAKAKAEKRGSAAPEELEESDDDEEADEDMDEVDEVDEDEEVDEEVNCWLHFHCPICTVCFHTSPGLPKPVTVCFLRTLSDCLLMHV